MERKLKTVGWREWLALPALNIPAIKAKIDTGARTSALHTCYIETFSEAGLSKVRFGLHPLQKRKDIEICCMATVIDERVVTDSGGHKELRLVIQTELELMNESWPIEMTLTTRDDMRFRMLLGRTALAGRCFVDPASSYLAGRKSRRIYTTRKK